MKFHVGDRWADQFENEWIVIDDDQTGMFPVCAVCVSVAPFNPAEVTFGSVRVFRENGHHGDAQLTRLISAERWIPFGEMMPEETEPSDKRSLLAGRIGFEPYILSRTETEGCWVCWRNRDETDCDTLEKLIAEGVTHWRYIQPPEAP